MFVHRVVERTVSLLLATGVGLVTLLATPAPAMAASIGALAGAGPRPQATRLKFDAGDRVKAQVDVGSGNLYVTVRGIALQGVSAQVEIGAFYNSAAAASSPTPRLGKGWGLDYTGDVRVAQQSDNSVTYYGPGGLVGNFPLVSGSTTTYTSAKGFKSDLVKSSSGWTLTERTSKVKRTFDTSGALISVTDRNGNTTSIASSTGQTSFADLTVTSTAGPVDARAATVKSLSSGVTSVRQPNVTAPREVLFATVGNVMVKATDPLGRDTTFGYDSNGLLTSIKAPGGASGAETSFTYDSSNRVTSITQVESSGSPGNSVTRLTYPSATQTLMASPSTDQGQAVASVPHTTYTIDSNQRVSKAVDAAGRTRADTFTANFDIASHSVGSSGSESTTTNTFGANSNESLTKTQSPTGAAQSFTYGTQSPNQYLPSKGTDDRGNNSTYTYNGAGNPLSSASAAAEKAQVSWNSDGTPSAAWTPIEDDKADASRNKTSYAYTDKQVSAITPVTGAGLGVRNYSYDIYGRLKSSSNGRGITTTLGYDVNDRLTTVDYGDGTGIAFTYTAAGQLETRTDSTGVTHYAYDQLGRMVQIQNSAFGGTTTYTYDKDSRLATSANPSSGGTITYSYDAAGTPTKISYPSGSGTKQTLFSTDDHNRRTATFMNSNDAKTTWTARTNQTYDKSDRVTKVTADVGTGTASYTRVVDITYCYIYNTTPGSSCTASVSLDRNKLEWKKDNSTGIITKYTYDSSGRLKSATQSGGATKTYSYGYNKNSNRTSATGSGQTNQSLTFNAANQITSTGYSYDAAGNLTAHPTQGTMTYTPDDQLKTVTKSGTTYQYKYGGRGNNELVFQTTPNGTYQYAYGRDDQQGNPVLEQVARNNTAASVISDPVTGQPLLLQTASGLQALIAYDGKPGSPVAILTSNAAVVWAADYNPFGVATITNTNDAEITNTNPYTFANGIADRTTGWIHYAARYYDPTTGTWTQQDPVDAPLDPNNANRYAYAGNDPINNTDPTGLSCAGQISGLIFSTIGFGVSLAGLIISGAGEVPTGGLATAPLVLSAFGYISSAYGIVASVGGVIQECR